MEFIKKYKIDIALTLSLLILSSLLIFTKLGVKELQNWDEGLYANIAYHECRPCTFPCKTCYGEKTTECNSCVQDYYLDNATCDVICPDLTYKNIEF